MNHISILSDYCKTVRCFHMSFYRDSSFEITNGRSPVLNFHIFSSFWLHHLYVVTNIILMIHAKPFNLPFPSYSLPFSISITTPSLLKQSNSLNLIVFLFCIFIFVFDVENNHKMVVIWVTFSIMDLWFHDEPYQ